MLTAIVIASIRATIRRNILDAVGPFLSAIIFQIWNSNGNTMKNTVNPKTDLIISFPTILVIECESISDKPQNAKRRTSISR